MSDRVDVGNLRVARVLYDFITNEALPGTGVDADAFWAGVDKVVTDLACGTASCSSAGTTCKLRSIAGTGSAPSNHSMAPRTRTS